MQFPAITEAHIFNTLDVDLAAIGNQKTLQRCFQSVISQLYHIVTVSNLGAVKTEEVFFRRSHILIFYAVNSFVA